MRVLARSASAVLVMLVLTTALGAQAGPYLRVRPDEEAVDRGRSLYAEQCINCHGLDVKGTESGPDLIRSVAVLRDEEGSEIGPAIDGVVGHPGGLSRDQLRDMSHFLKQQIEMTARNRNPAIPPDVLTGDAASGRAWFNGAGGCSGCHSADGDLAGIGARYSPVNLQQRFLFPRGAGATPARVSVTPEGGATVSGTVRFLDDFFVSLTDETGTYHSFRRVPGIEVEVEDPYQGHWDLLARITDQNMHDVVTYLETLR